MATGERSDPVTASLEQRPQPFPGSVPRFRLTILGSAKAGAPWESTADTCSIGYHPLNDVVVNDPTVSRFHCELKVDGKHVRLRDLDSRNGTLVDGVAVVEAFLRPGSLIQVGQVSLRFELATAHNQLPISASTSFGSLVGRSTAARASFALMERAAATQVTVLLEGETGTGKTAAAEAIHDASARRDKPLVVIDCGAIPANLLESELFGHEKGAFTGATTQRIGAFEEADGGTIFLDEIGELPADLQPKLLRVIENRQIRRVGSNLHRPIDVRIIAATNQDLRREVNESRFRSDLYYRFAVVRIRLPPLRQRPEDIPLLVDQLLTSISATGPHVEGLRDKALLDQLASYAWPGNVRELRNYLERSLFFQDAHPPEQEEMPAPSESSVEIDASRPYSEARRLAIDSFERGYLKALFKIQPNVAKAAVSAGMGRINLYKLVKKHRLK